MNVTKFDNITIRPTEKKMKKVKKITEDILSSSTPSSLSAKKPNNKTIYIPSERDIFEKTKNSTQTTLEKIKR